MVDFYERKVAPEADMDVASASLKSREAELESAGANQAQTEAVYETSLLTFQAQVESASIAVRQAELDLSYCRMGSAYVNDFNKFGKTCQVRVQADQQFRLQPEDIRRLEVRNQAGQMMPLGTLASIRKTLGPQIVPRYSAN